MNEIIVKKMAHYAAMKGNEEGYKTEIQGNVVKCKEGDNVYELDVTKYLDDFKLFGEDICYFMIDLAIQRDYIKGPDIDTTHPYLGNSKQITNEVIKHRVEVIGKSKVLLINRDLEKQDMILKDADLTEYPNIMERVKSNLERDYSGSEIQFVRVSNSNTYMLSSLFLNGNARSIIFLESVQTKIRDMFGKTYYIIISDSENLFVTSKQNDIKNEMDYMMIYGSYMKINQFDVYTEDGSGGFIQELTFISNC